MEQIQNELAKDLEEIQEQEEEDLNQV